MYKLYYQPEGGWVGDCMPCYHDEEFYLYYQCDHRLPKPFPDGEPFGWSLAKSRDMVAFRDFGEVLKKGEKFGREHCLYAGSVIHALGCFRAFYTGECKAYVGTDFPKEVIMFARSGDGIGWVKEPELTITAPDGYEKDFFRDPYVFYDGGLGKWLMLIAARHKNGPKVRKSSLVYYSSDDLEHWDFKGDLWYPEMYHLLQMPDLFQIGDWWYLFFSEYDDERKTRYRMSKSIFGPWIAPADDCLDGRAYYAARTIPVGDKRYLFGWNPTRRDGKDTDMWVWGGTAVMQELYQREDKTLAVKLPELFEKRFVRRPVEVCDFELSRCDGNDDRVIVTDSGSFYRLDFDVEFEESTYAFGIKMYENSEEDIGYAYHFSPGRNMVVFDKLPNYPWFTCMNRGLSRMLKLRPDETYHVTVIVDDDISVLYVDGVALNARMCEKPGSEIRFYVHGGGIRISNLRMFDDIK